MSKYRNAAVAALEAPSSQGELWNDDATKNHLTPGGIPIRFRVDDSTLTASSEKFALGGASQEQLELHLTLARLQLLRGFDQLLCLDGLTGVEHLPHQIETVRKVLRRFRGRVLLADEVGLGKTIEACLLLREYLMRGLAKRVLILTPNPLVTQWQAELSEKFHLDFQVPPRTAASDRPEYWREADRVLVATSFARSGRRSAAIAAAPWDLVIVDEAHHCKNRSTKLWQLVNSLKRRHMFLLTATPVQNNLLELYSLLTLLEPGHLKTEADFRRQFVTRGNPRDPRNRHRLRELLGEVMIRNTRGLVQLDLPPRYAQTVIARMGESESLLHREMTEFLRGSSENSAAGSQPDLPDDDLEATDAKGVPRGAGPASMSRLRLHSLLRAQGSHPAALAQSLAGLADDCPLARRLQDLAASIDRSAKDEKLLELLRQSHGHKVLVFVHSLRTLHRLQELLSEDSIPHSTFSGEQSAREKDDAVEALRSRVQVMLCTDSGGEGRNLQFADTLINYDLPWNPMRIEQRIGRVHRYGQTQDVFIFNLCTDASIESCILTLLNDKIRMFEMVVGEIGVILGNLEGGEEFESLVFKLWLQSTDDRDLQERFNSLGTALLDAKQDYLRSQQLDEDLFGEDYE